MLCDGQVSNVLYYYFIKWQGNQNSFNFFGVLNCEQILKFPFCMIFETRSLKETGEPFCMPGWILDVWSI